MARRRAIAIRAPSQVSSGLAILLVRWLAILLVLVALALGGVAGFLTYRIISIRNTVENVTPLSYPQISYQNVNFKSPAGGEREGWLLLGLKGAPVIILCHGYNSNRAELLWLGNVLAANHFNVYLFNFYGPSSRNYSLGVAESQDLAAAIEAITKRPEVNAHRLGLYGSTVGGYATLAVAERDSRVKTLVLDTIYEHPNQMFEARLEALLGGSSSVFRFLAVSEFRLLALRGTPPKIRDDLPKLANIPKFFISGRDTPLLAAVTEEVYNLAPQPKRLMVMDHSQSSLASVAEKEEYGNQVLSYFLHNLPLRAD